MIYLFNNNEEMIRIIPNSAIKRMYQTQTLTDENYISDRLSVEIQALNDEELSELEYMAIDDIENPQRFHYYFIVKETTEHQVTSLTGVQSGIEELRKTPVYDMRPTNLSPKLIADRLLEGTNWQAGYTTDDVGTISTNFYYTDVFSALKKMCMAFGIEMQFFVEITTNRIGARYIEFRKRTGKSVGKRVVYGHNALKIVKEVEKTNTVTALIGRGKGVQVSESDEGNIGYGRKIGIENVEWKTSSGAPVDKPLGQEYVEIPDLTLQYGIKNSNGTVRPKIGFVEFQDEESETRLIDRTYNALLELSRPQVLLETSSVYLPDTGIGDTINVVRHDRDLRYQTRVFEITWDRLANQAVDMKLGDRLGESENKRISNISNQISGNISTELGPTIEELIDRVTTADGKNTNWYTDYDPMENPDTKGLVRVNDNWYQPDPEYEGEFILKQWNGEMWVEILRTSGNPELVRRFEEFEQQAEELSKDIEASDQKADEAKETAGLAKSASEAAEVIAQQAQAEAESAKSSSDEALGKVSEAVGKANDAISKANRIPQDIQNEIESKGLVSGSWVESHVNDVTGEINYALAEVSGSIPTVILGVIWDKSKNPILTRTDYVEEYANLTDYLLKTNEIDLSIDGLSGRMSEVETKKLDSTEFTRFKTNDYDVTVSGFRTALTDKLDTETFNTFKTNEFEMTVDGINGSIESLETEKLDSTDFNTFKSNEYELTVDGLRMDLSSVSGSIPTVIMGVEWDKTESPILTRTDYLEYDNPNLYAPSFVMGVMWDKKESPTMYRIADTGGVGDYEFTALQADYNFTKENWSTRLSQIENTDYATKTWSNQTFATPRSVTTQLQSYAKTTDLNGMVTETTLATKNFITAGSVNTLLTSYAKTGDVPTATQFNSLKNRYDSMEQIIGTDKDSVARAVMTSSLWETEVSKVIDDELEQEYKTVTSKVNVVDGSKGINNGEGTGEGRYFYFNNSDGVVEGTLSRNATYTVEFSTQSSDNKGNAITLQVKPYGTTEWQPIVTGQMTSGKQISTFTFKNNVFASSVSDYRLLISSANGSNVPYIWGFRLYQEVEVEVPIEGTNTGAISSKITQLYNMINLSILGKDGALSRIAIGEDGIQIDGKLLHITAKTYIDEAVIKSAMIDTLDASKITTGELNASLIRVVNLDAQSIAGNEASFIRAMFSGTKSTLQITGSGVSILDNLGRSSTYLDSSGIEFSRQGVNLGKLEYVTNEANSGDLNNMHGFSMRPNRNSYFGISYFPSTSATTSIRRFAVSGRTGNVYISGLIKPSEQQIYGIDITWGTITNVGTNVRIMNHNGTGGIQINDGDISYKIPDGTWRSLNSKLG